MNINAFGTDIFLRFTIRNRLTKLKEDDRVSLGPVSTGISSPDGSCTSDCRSSLRRVSTL